jgi:hypothetical protein
VTRFLGRVSRVKSPSGFFSNRALASQRAYYRDVQDLFEPIESALRLGLPQVIDVDQATRFRRKELLECTVQPWQFAPRSTES